MLKREPKPENLAKLTPEQRKIFDGWLKEQERADILIQKGLDALAVNDQQGASKAFQELDKLIPATCEHGKSIWDSCMACEEIDRILFPEMYDADGNRMPDPNENEALKAIETIYLSSKPTPNPFDIN